MPFVIVTKGSPGVADAPSRTQQIAAGILRIGHGPHCDLILPDSSAGAEQAVIHEIKGAYVLRHVNERGQTFVNDKPVKEALLTKKGTIRIGMVNLHFSRQTRRSPLTIEFRPMADTGQTLRIDLAKTLVMDPDATQKLMPLSGQDPEKTLVLQNDPDRTQRLDPNKTLTLPPKKRKRDAK